MASCCSKHQVLPSSRNVAVCLYSGESCYFSALIHFCKRKIFNQNLLKEIYWEGRIQKSGYLSEAGKRQLSTEQVQGLYRAFRDRVLPGLKIFRVEMGLISMPEFGSVQRLAEFYA